MPKRPSAMALLGICHLTWKRHLQAGLRRHGITLQQFYLLRQLDRRGPLRPAQVAELLFCDRPTATVIVANLERRGWARPAPGPADGRQRLVRLAPAGRNKLRRVEAAARRTACEDPMGCFAPAERRQMAGWLRRLRAHLERLTGGAKALRRSENA